MAVFHLFQGHYAASPLEKSVTISYDKNTIDICKYIRSKLLLVSFFSLFTWGFLRPRYSRSKATKEIFGLCTRRVSLLV